MTFIAILSLVYIITLLSLCYFLYKQENADEIMAQETFERFVKLGSINLEKIVDTDEDRLMTLKEYSFPIMTYTNKPELQPVIDLILFGLKDQLIRLKIFHLKGKFSE